MEKIIREKMKMKVNVCLALILANVCLAEAKSQPNLRRIILETETNFVPSEKKDFEALIDRGEDKTKSHKKHKMKVCTNIYGLGNYLRE